MMMFLALAALLATPDEVRICELINQARATNGRPALVVSSALYAAAKAHSDDMAVNGCYQHNSCNGEHWATRIRRYYPLPTSLGEVINFGGTPEEIVSTWMQSDAHRAILLSTVHREIGCAATPRQTNFGEFNMATADLGSRPGAIPTVSPQPSSTPAHTVAPTGFERFLFRSTRVRSTLSVTLLVLAGARIDGPVSLELDGELVVALSDECVAPVGRGARSVCGSAVRLRIAPSRAPHYRLRLEFPGVYAAQDVRLSAMGQNWELQ